MFIHNIKTTLDSFLVITYNPEMRKIRKDIQTFDNIKEHITNSCKISNTGCMEWIHNLDITGYGRVRCEGKMWKVHRLMWTLVNGDIPKGMYICHYCDNWACFNPAHLWLGTSKQNHQDMIQKQRTNPAIEERHSSVKLKWFEVLEIRRRYSTGEWTHQQLMEEFNLNHTESIGCIIRGKNWGWLHPDYYLI